MTVEFSDNPEVREVQATHMYHRCDKRCENDTGREGDCHCSKGYPKEYRDHTADGNDSYPEYRRRSPDNGGHEFRKNPGTDREEVLDNRRVVPHNIFLLMKYRCHLNVEVCNSITAVKYLYKYVYKGHDKVMYGVKSKDHLDLPADQTQGPGRDEIKEFVEARYCSTSEACWRTFEFSMGKLYPKVQRLNVHMLDEQHVLFSSDPEETRQVLKESEMTQLTAFFMVCEEEYQMYTGQDKEIPPYRCGGPPARDLLYRDVAKWYKWVKRNKKQDINPHWERRKQRQNHTVGRVRHVPPIMECKDLFHLST